MFHVIVGVKELVLLLFAFCRVGAWPLEADAQCQNLILLLTQFLFHLANHSFLYDINFFDFCPAFWIKIIFLSDLKHNLTYLHTWTAPALDTANSHDNYNTMHERCSSHEY